jgi:hypothetical protein
MLAPVRRLILGWLARCSDLHADLGPTCGFLGCTNPTEGDYLWQMCDDCYEMACEWDDSEMLLDGSW